MAYWWIIRTPILLAILVSVCNVCVCVDCAVCPKAMVVQGLLILQPTAPLLFPLQSCLFEVSRP
jgi:hypothetical protein